MKTPWIFLKYILTRLITSVKSLVEISLDNMGEDGLLKSP